MGGALQIVPEHLALQRREVNRVHCSAHVKEPTVSRLGVDLERGVSHPKTGVTADFLIRARPAPILLEEAAQPPLSTLHIIIGIHRAQDGIFTDGSVKSVDERVKGIGAADLVEKTRFLIYDDTSGLGEWLCGQRRQVDVLSVEGLGDCRVKGAFHRPLLARSYLYH